MDGKLTIDIVSDIVCPWCIIGYLNLQQAISELDIETNVSIQWQPFELNPDMPPEGENLREHSARKYGSTAKSSMGFREEMTQRGKDLGFAFNYFDEMKIVNTRDAHVLLEYAKGYNLQTELKLRLFSAFFTEQKDISNREVLAQEIASVGLNVNEAMSRLNHENAIKDIVKQESDWHRLGVSSVPTVVVNRTHALAGAQPVEAFIQLLSSQLLAK